MKLPKVLEPYAEYIKPHIWDSHTNYYIKNKNEVVVVNGLPFWKPRLSNTGVDWLDTKVAGNINSNNPELMTPCQDAAQCYINALINNEFPVGNGYPPRLTRHFATKRDESRELNYYLVCLSCFKPYTPSEADRINDYLGLTNFEDLDLSFLSDF